jgi:hypothetical protein
MKFISTIILASFFSLSAFAEAVECVAPREMTGGASIEMADLKPGKKNAEGYVTYKGVLKVTIGGSTRTPVFKGSVKVTGVLLVDGALLLHPTDSTKVATIYINQNQFSYVEMVDGKSFNTNCRFY